MKQFAAVIFLSVGLLTGCATSQNVSLGQLSGAKSIKSAALVPSDGNSSDMDTAVRTALLNQGVSPKLALPPGTRKSSDVDVILDYSDQWRWDMAMYLKWVSINMYDAETGNLLANARWDNSTFHGFQDYKLVVKGLIDQMLDKVRNRPN